MSGEKLIVQCVLGHDKECTPECPNYPFALRVVQEIGPIKPKTLRTLIFFADALDPRIQLINVAHVIASCPQERQAQSNDLPFNRESIDGGL